MTIELDDHDRPPGAFRLFLAVAALSIALLGLQPSAGANEPRLLNVNPGFENGLTGWETYVAPSLRGQAIVDTVGGGSARFGNRALRLRLPAAAVDNQRDWIRVGQRLDLEAGRQYEFSAAVRWNNPGNRLPSAIVSAWCLHSDGSYSGVDQWIHPADVEQAAARNGYVPVRFGFSPGQSGESLCYIALLTHQDGNRDATEILVDAFRISDLGDRPNADDHRQGNLLIDGTFDAGPANVPGPAWTPTVWNPTGVGGLSQGIATTPDRALRLTLPRNVDERLNNTWTGVTQTVSLRAGVTYALSATVDRTGPGEGVPTIVNLFAYFPGTPGQPEQWIGSIDYKFSTEREHPYRQTFTPAVDGDYQITARVFGWGNTAPFSVTIDDLDLRVVR